MMPTFPKKPKIPLTADEAKLIERMIRGCCDFVAGNITLDQLWYRSRGQRMGQLIQRVTPGPIGFALFHLYLDFVTWKDDRDDLIFESAAAVVVALESEQAHGAQA